MAAVEARRAGYEVAETVAFFCAVLAYLWFLAIPLPWTGVVIPLAVVVSWRRRSLTLAALGLGWNELIRSARAWRLLWIACTLLFVGLGYRVLLRFSAWEQGCVYFGWSAAQQVVYQSMVYVPLRHNLKNRWVAAGLSGIAFALAHAPNPILLPGTLVWGVASSLLFERCRTVWGLALMQVMLSSMLLWVTPPALHRNFRIGPYYYEVRTGEAPASTFAPPIEMPR